MIHERFHRVNTISNYILSTIFIYHSKSTFLLICIQFSFYMLNYILWVRAFSIPLDIHAHGAYNDDRSKKERITWTLQAVSPSA